MNVSGTVSLANIRLSLVNGTAFVDFSAAGTLTPYLNGRLTLTDSAGKKTVGYLKAAGTGETLDSEMVSDPGFDNAAHWTAGASWSVAGGVATCAGGTGSNLQNTSGTGLGAKRLYKTVFEISARTAGTVVPRYPQIGTAVSAVTTHTQYILNADTISEKPMIQSVTGTFAGSVTSFSIKQVLTPSATGVTITSTPGGTTYNWESVEAGFNYNDASGFSYILSRRHINTLDLGYRRDQSYKQGNY